MVEKLVAVMSGRSTYNVRDEDDMTSDDAHGVPTQQSVKAYTDAKVAAQKVYVRGEVADISSSGSSWAIAPIAGTITKITSVIDGAITGGDAVLTFELATVAVTGGSITIANSGSAAGDVDTCTPTAANAVTAGQAIEIITDQGSTGTVKAVLLFEITPS